MSSPLLTKAVKDATTAQKRIQRVAELLAKLMQDIHGEEWKVDISHEYETEMVLIVPHPGRRRRKPAPPISEVA